MNRQHTIFLVNIKTHFLRQKVPQMSLWPDVIGSDAQLLIIHFLYDSIDLARGI